MKDLKPPRDLLEVVGEAYELLLEKSLEEGHKIKEKGNLALHHFIDEAQKDLSIVEELGKEETEKLANYLKRDLIDAANYINKTGRELKDWLGFDIALIEDRLREMFFQAADQTTKELLELKYRAEIAEYRTGEITGPGTLVCDKCQEKLHFHKPGHIPPCPKCRGTHYHRDKIGE